jgi:pyoverdine/dityrosine biosynthesis protein Dit1
VKSSEIESFYTFQQFTIEMILPAFPCKSSSLDKVAGPCPDKGEEMALRTMYAFIKDIEAIYSPGARMLIVSDGHVFSDCIGVNDVEVDIYGAKLIAMKDALFDTESDNIHIRLSIPR